MSIKKFIIEFGLEKIALLRVFLKFKIIVREEN